MDYLTTMNITHDEDCLFYVIEEIKKQHRIEIEDRDKQIQKLEENLDILQASIADLGEIIVLLHNKTITNLEGKRVGHGYIINASIDGEVEIEL